MRATSEIACLLAAMALAAALAGCVPTTPDPVSQDVGELKRTVAQQQSAVADLRKALDALKAESADLRLRTQALPKEESIAAIRNSQATLYTQVSDLLTELQMLNGKFDEYKYLVDRQFKQAGSELELIRQKIDSGSPAGDGAVSAKLAAMEADLAVVRGRVDAISALGKGAAPASGGAAAMPEVLYEDARKDFEAKNYPAAREKFRGFLELHPSHWLAGNSVFWIGESFYAESKFEDAILAYEDVIKKYKDNQKVPAAMLKQAYAFERLGDLKAARVILGELIRIYPKDGAADLARQKLKELK